jgi:hypothetical protein
MESPVVSGQSSGTANPLILLAAATQGPILRRTSIERPPLASAKYLSDEGGNSCRNKVAGRSLGNGLH